MLTTTHSTRSADQPRATALRRLVATVPLVFLFLLAAGHGTASAAGTFVVTTTADSGPGSLRAALVLANGSPGHDTIAFAIGSGGVRFIVPQTPLPEITDPVTIDGTTQPGAPSGSPRISLVGTQLDGTPSYGLRVAAGSSTVRGLAIYRFRIGIALHDAGGNVIRGNHIGTDFTGTLALPNADDAIYVRNGSNGNTIGGAAPGDRNVIVGHVVIHDSSDNVVQGNYVGVNAAGTDQLGPGGGIGVVDYRDNPSPAAHNLIGGSTLGAGNVIACGIGLVAPVPSDNRVLGNRIGTNAGVTRELCSGVAMNMRIHVDAPTSSVGGTIPGARNVILGRIVVDGYSSGSSIAGNYIGTNATGTAALGGPTGIYLQGGHVTVRDNLISGTGDAGLSVRTGDDNVITGNRIGTNAAGTACIGSFAFGVYLEGHSGTAIGGTGPNEGNLISCNSDAGIHLEATDNMRIQGNRIGTNAAGLDALPNGTGIEVAATHTLIGGGDEGAGNVIAGNSDFGIQLAYSNSEHNVILGNRIGGAEISRRVTPGNGNAGIYFGASCPKNNMVGGTAGGANVIAHNGGPGVADLCGTGNVIRGNAIYANNGLGIDLQPIGHTDNDPGDTDSGPNDLQNHPTLTLAAPASSGGTLVEGELGSTPDTRFRIDVYASAACDPSGYGEGERFLGTLVVFTDAAGHASFSSVLPAAVPAGQTLTLTATNPQNSTSEFSACKKIEAQADLLLSVTASPDTVDAGAQLTYTIVAKNGGPSDADAVAVTTAVTAGAALVSVQASPGGSCATDSSGGTVNVKCDWAGATTTGTPRTVTLIVTALDTGPLVLDAKTTSSTFDPDTSNNTAQLQTVVK